MESFASSFLRAQQNKKAIQQKQQQAEIEDRMRTFRETAKVFYNNNRGTDIDGLTALKREADSLGKMYPEMSHYSSVLDAMIKSPKKATKTDVELKREESQVLGFTTKVSSLRTLMKDTPEAVTNPEFAEKNYKNLGTEYDKTIRMIDAIDDDDTLSLKAHKAMKKATLEYKELLEVAIGNLQPKGKFFGESETEVGVNALKERLPKAFLQ